MINRWFYIDGSKVISLGTMSMQKAREYEEDRALDGRLLTVTGLDMLRDEINQTLKLPKNAKQLEKDFFDE